MHVPVHFRVYGTVLSVVAGLSANCITFPFSFAFLSREIKSKEAIGSFVSPRSCHVGTVCAKIRYRY